jgi:hypothetical protein
MLIELKTQPLGFQVTVPLGDGQHAVRAFTPLTVEAAQALALALLVQPGVGEDLKPEIIGEIQTEARERTQSDAAFLKDMGVSLCDPS